MKRPVTFAALLTFCFTTSQFMVAQDLSPKGQQIVDYLLEDWAKQMHSTGISLAMENLGIKPDDALRIEVGKYFRANTSLHNNLTWWGANNYILSGDEKRIGKWLINNFEKDKKIPSPAESAESLGVSEQELRKRLDFLARAGLLVPDEQNPLGYRLTERYARWGGPLRYNAHTVTVGHDDAFDVW